MPKVKNNSSCDKGTHVRRVNQMKAADFRADDKPGNIFNRSCRCKDKNTYAYKSYIPSSNFSPFLFIMFTCLMDTKQEN